MHYHVHLEPCDRVLGQHRQEFAGPGAVAEADEERDRGVHHGHGLGHRAGAAPEAGRPVPPAGVVALDAVRLLLADAPPAFRDQLGLRRPSGRAVPTRVPALPTFEPSAQGGGVTTAARPVDHSPWGAIPSPPDPELIPLFSGGAPPRPARPRRRGPRARASARRLRRTARLDPAHHAGGGRAQQLGGAVHPRVRPEDPPPRSSSTAVTLTRSGRPRGGVAVKPGPPAVQR